MKSKSFVRVLTVTLITAAALIPPAPASASADGVMTCPLGTETTTYDPPLGPFTQHVDVHVAGSVAGCLPNTQNIVGGQFEADAEGDLNCLTGGNSAGIFTFEWNTGQKTRVSFPNIAITLRPLGETIVVITGTVLSGPFAGGTMVFQTTLLTLDLTACLTGNVDAVSGPVVVAFLDL